MRTYFPATHSSKDWVCGADVVGEMAVETTFLSLCYKTALLLILHGIMPAFRSRWDKYIWRKKMNGVEQHWTAELCLQSVVVQELERQF